MTRIILLGIGMMVTLSACSDGHDNITVTQPLNDELDVALRNVVSTKTPGGINDFILPDSTDFENIPQDPQNPITNEKVALGQMLFHDTGIGIAGDSEHKQTWSCASCHHAAAGFKSGVLQGIGEGGHGFGKDGSDRTLMPGFEPSSDVLARKPDVQPLTSPTVLNVAYQDVMLWNGQFGNNSAGGINANLPANILTPDTTPVAENRHKLSGVETQAVAGLGVHRLSVENSSPLQTMSRYRALWSLAYGSESTDTLVDSAKAIAAFERTVLANKAPFQLWLRGDDYAMTPAEKRGAALFFGKANCTDCHTGPALSSLPNATEADVFMATGLNDFDTSNPAVAGEVEQKVSFGRGGFTGVEADNYRFKVPQLYNLADTDVFGHGGSFRDLRELIEYKNRAVPENPATIGYIDSRFVPLELSTEEMDDLVQFLATGLYDPDLLRYQPSNVPSGMCVVVDPMDEQRVTFCE